MRLFILFFYLFFSTFSNAEVTENKQDYVIDENAKVRESTDELIIREITIDPETHPGNALYQENCAICHDGSIGRLKKIFNFVDDLRIANIRFLQNTDHFPGKILFFLIRQIRTGDDNHRDWTLQVISKFS